METVKNIDQIASTYQRNEDKNEVRNWKIRKLFDRVSIAIRETSRRPNIASQQKELTRTAWQNKKNVRRKWNNVRFSETKILTKVKQRVLQAACETQAFSDHTEKMSLRTTNSNTAGNAKTQNQPQMTKSKQWLDQQKIIEKFNTLYNAELTR